MALKNKEPKVAKPVVAESLATKYRPKTLEGIVGQKSVVTQLRGMFKSGKMPTTLLLAGESGTGKTTLARLIARYLNCSEPAADTHAPCNECLNCKYQDNHPDVLELNMADTRGIDDVRGLIQSSRNNPTIGNTRVIICDEVHAITAQAAQTFLKPLEDPPKHTLWILATTNPEKLPGTILGRCHQFSLSKLDSADLTKRIYVIAKREGVNLREMEGGDKIVETIVTLGNGRMRDCIQLLESAIFAIHSGEDISPKEILAKFLSTPEAELDNTAAAVLAAVLAGELKGMLKAVRTSGNARGVMHKMRWLVQGLLDSAIGIAKYQPYSQKQFSKIANEKEIKVNLMQLVSIQGLLLDMENRFNTTNVDEGIQMLGMLGQYMAANQKKA